MMGDEVKDLLLKIALKDDHLSFKKIYFAYYDRLFQLAKAITKCTEISILTNTFCCFSVT